MESLITIWMETIKNKLSLNKLLLAIGLIVYISYGLACLFYGSVLPEDGSYLYECYAAYQGKIPFFEFQSNPSILWPYLYGLPQYIFGLNLYVGKLTSLFFVLLNLWLIYKIASEISGPKAGTIAVLLTSVNFYSLALFMHINTYALAVSFSLGSLWLLWRDKYYLALAVLLSGLLIRLSLAPLLVLSLIYIIWINRESKKARLIGFLAFTVITAIFIYILSLINWPLLKILLFAPFGAGITNLQLYPEDWGKGSLVFSLNKLQIIYNSIFYNNFPFTLLWLMALIFYKNELIVLKSRLRHLNKKESFCLFLSAGAIAVFLLHLMPTPGYGAYNCILVPVFAILTGAGAAKIYSSRIERFPRILLFTFLAGIVFLTFFLQVYELGKGSDNPIRQINQLGEYIDKSVPADEKILSFYMPVAIAAKREVLPYTTRGYHSYAALIPKAAAEKLFVVNTGMLSDLISQQKAGAIFLTDGTFYNRLVKAPREKEFIEQGINKNYYLVKQVENFAGQGTGYLYFRREMNKK